MMANSRSFRASVSVSALAAFLTVGAAAALAQNSTYSSNWQNPDASQSQVQPGSGDVQDMVDELNSLVDSASAARAADPKFLRDLRDLARRYDWPWRNRVLFDDFSDGNVHVNPAWTVGGVPVTIDRFDGLRTRVVNRRRTTTSSSQQQREAAPEELAVQLLGQILSGNSGSNNQQQQQQSQPEPENETVLATSARTANQFAIQADIIFADAVNGYIEMGVIQGADGLGYRIGIRPGVRDAAVEILRVGSRGTGVVDSAQVAAATWTARPSHQPRAVLFTRDDIGNMNVSIDGTIVLTANDRAFRDGFDGFIVRNGGGDYSIKTIAGYSR